MPGPKKNFSETQLGDDEEARFGITSGYYWKYDSAAGQYELHTDDDGTGNDAVVLKVDDLSGVLDIMDDLNFPNITGAPTFSTHDHSEGGLTSIPGGGLGTASVTPSKVDGSGGNSGDVLQTDGTAGGVSWGSVGGGELTKIDTFTDTTDTSTLDYDPGAFGNTYDTLVADVYVIDYTDTSPELRAQVNGVTTSSYDSVTLDSGGNTPIDAASYWVLCTFDNTNTDGANVFGGRITIRKPTSLIDAYPTLEATVSTANNGRGRIHSGTLDSLETELNQIRIFGNGGNQTAQIDVFGGNFG